MARPRLSDQEKKDRALERTRSWKKKNPHSVRLQRHRRKVRIIKAGEKVIAKDPTGELEYSGIEGIDEPYVQADRTDPSSQPSPGNQRPVGDAAVHGAGPDQPLPGIPDNMVLAPAGTPPADGIQEPEDFTAELNRRTAFAELKKFHAFRNQLQGIDVEL